MRTFRCTAFSPSEPGATAASWRTVKTLPHRTPGSAVFSKDVRQRAAQHSPAPQFHKGGPRQRIAGAR